MKLFLFSLLIIFLYGCTPESKSLFGTVTTLLPHTRNAIQPQLNPAYAYLRVTAGDRVAYLVKGYDAPAKFGRIRSVWYSQQGEVLQIEDGRIVATAGLTTDWVDVRYQDLPSWERTLNESGPWHYQRTRDLMPGYRFGITERLTLSRIPPPKTYHLVNVAATELQWFEERTEPLSSAASETAHLPPARYAVLKAPVPLVIYAEVCLDTQLCLAWQAWQPENSRKTN